MARYEVHQSDANAEAIYAAARKLGMSVSIINRPLDALIGAFGLTVVAEVKTPRGRLRPTQERFLEKFCGWAVVLRTVQDVVDLKGQMHRVSLQGFTGGEIEKDVVK